jgi:hypothetical protein
MSDIDDNDVEEGTVRLNPSGRHVAEDDGVDETEEELQSLVAVLPAGIPPALDAQLDDKEQRELDPLLAQQLGALPYATPTPGKCVVYTGRRVASRYLMPHTFLVDTMLHCRAASILVDAVRVAAQHADADVNKSNGAFLAAVEFAARVSDNEWTPSAVDDSVARWRVYTRAASPFAQLLDAAFETPNRVPETMASVFDVYAVPLAVVVLLCGQHDVFTREETVADEWICYPPWALVVHAAAAQAAAAARAVPPTGTRKQ